MRSVVHLSWTFETRDLSSLYLLPVLPWLNVIGSVTLWPFLTVCCWSVGLLDTWLVRCFVGLSWFTKKGRSYTSMLLLEHLSSNIVTHMVIVLSYARRLQGVRMLCRSLRAGSLSGGGWGEGARLLLPPRHHRQPLWKGHKNPGRSKNIVRLKRGQE